MKKIITVISLLLTFSSLSAQDTIPWGGGPYMWPPMSFPTDTIWERSFLSVVDKIVIQRVTEKPVQVRGLAFVFHGEIMPMHDPYNGNYELCMMIYQQDSDRTSIHLLDSVPINQPKVEAARRNHRIVRYLYRQQSAPHNTELRHDTIAEFYFHTPVLVHDSFWICLGSCDGRTPIHAIHVSLVHVRTDTSFYMSMRGVTNVSDWRYLKGDGQPAMLPIVSLPEEDTLALPPKPETPILKRLDADSASATLRWQTYLLSNYRIALGTDTLSPDNNPTYTFTRPTATFPGLEPNRTYAAWLRYEDPHHCFYHDTLLVGPWSDPLLFSLPSDTTTTSGILSPSSPATPTSDPAYYDLLGRPVAHPKPNHLYIHNRRKIIYRPEQ